MPGETDVVVLLVVNSAHIASALFMCAFRNCIDSGSVMRERRRYAELVAVPSASVMTVARAHT
jgi:hypothetical protein